MNHYEILGIDQGASREQIRAAYLRRVQIAHPDRHVGEANSEWHDRFKRIHAAYEVLYDEERREEYDRVCLLPRGRHVATVVARERHDHSSEWLTRRMRRKSPVLRRLLYFAMPVVCCAVIVSLGAVRPWHVAEREPRGYPPLPVNPTPIVPPLFAMTGENQDTTAWEDLAEGDGQELAAVEEVPRLVEAPKTKMKSLSAEKYEQSDVDWKKGLPRDGELHLGLPEVPSRALPRPRYADSVLPIDFEDDATYVSNRLEVAAPLETQGHQDLFDIGIESHSTRTNVSGRRRDHRAPTNSLLRGLWGSSPEPFGDSTSYRGRPGSSPAPLGSFFGHKQSSEYVKSPPPTIPSGLPFSSAPTPLRATAGGSLGMALPGANTGSAGTASFTLFGVTPPDATTGIPLNSEGTVSPEPISPLPAESPSGPLITPGWLRTGR